MLHSQVHSCSKLFVLFEFEDDLGFGHGNVEKMNDLHMLQLLCVCSIFKLSLCGTKITVEVYLLL